MRRVIIQVTLGVVMQACLLGVVPAEEVATQTKPGSTFTITFPDMPPTFYDLYQNKDVKAQMIVFLPANYDPARLAAGETFLSSRCRNEKHRPTFCFAR